MLKRWGPPLLLGLACGTAISLWFHFDYALGHLMQLGEYQTYDFRMKRLLPPAKATRDVVFVNMSQRSLDVYNAEGIGWPWPREFYGMMLRSTRDAKVVLFDFLFESDDPRGTDGEFAAELKQHGNAYLACMYRIDEDESPQAQAKIDEALQKYRIRVNGSELLHGVPKAGRFALPVDALLASSRGLATVAASLDEDGIIRRWPMICERQGSYIASFSLRAIMHLKGVNEVSVVPGPRMRVGDLEFPIDRSGCMIIRYYGPSLTIPHVGMDKLIRTGYLLSEMEREKRSTPAVPLPVDPREFKDKIIVAGTTAPGLMDHFATPVDKLFYGAEVHATVIANALSYGMIRPPNPGFTLALIAICSLLGGLLFARTTILFGSIVFVVLLIGVIGGSFLAFALNRWIEIFPPLVATLVTFGSAQAFNYLTEGRRRHLVTNTFKRYVAPTVVNELLKNPELVNMMGSRKRLTILFLDFEGFTKLSEKLDPKDLMELLNQYHREGVAEIFATEGTFDKFVGDAIVAYWGAPIDQADQAARACRTAVGIQKRLKALHAGAKDELLFRARIGLNTGECIWGNVGQGILQNISIIGDEVNLTSRLEGANKLFGTPIMISESTYQEAKDQLVVREIGPIRVVGKQKPVRVYELIGMKGEADETAARAFADAWKKFYARDFSGALAIFSRFDDKLAKKCADQCRKLIDHPPDEPWEFVIDVESK